MPPGVKESDTGLAAPNLWDIPADRQRISEEAPLQVARCTKIIPVDPEKKAAAEAMNPLGGNQGQKGADEQDKYVINIKQIAKFVVGLADRVAPTDIEEGMRVGYAPFAIRWFHLLTRVQCRSYKVSDHDPIAPQDRCLRYYDASRGEARRYLL